MGSTGALSPRSPRVWSNGWTEPPTERACGLPPSSTCAATRGRCSPRPAVAISFWWRWPAWKPIWGSLGCRCWTRSAASPDASARTLGGGAAADLHYRVISTADPADDHLGPGRGAARILPLRRGDDRGRPGRGDCRLDGGAGPHHGLAPLRGAGARRQPAKLYALGVRHAPGPLDRPGGLRLRNIGGHRPALLRSDGRGAGDGSP